MKSIRNVVVAVLPVFGIAAVFAGGFEAREETPGVFYSAVEERASPLWVSADLARTPQNQIDWKLFPPNESASLRRQLAVQERLKATEGARSLTAFQASGQEAVEDDNCVTYEKTFHHLSGELKAPGLQGLLASARGIYSASIVDISHGFFHGSPASVLKLDLGEIWKTDERLPVAEELFAVYPFARFAIGEGVFCSGVPGSLPQLEIGQRVIVFITSDPLDRQRTLVWADPEHLIVEMDDGGIFLPQALKNDIELFPVKSFGEVETLLRSASGNPRRPPLDRRRSDR